MEDHLRHIPVVIRMTDPEQGFAKGGLATAAGRVKDAGRKGDDMLLHVNKDEFELLRQQWGEPTINPQTGMPEFFSFKKIAKKLAGPVAGVALNALAPGVGSAVGSALGVGSSLGSALASGAVGAGVGYLADGKDGALYGGLAGAASPYVFGNGTTPGILSGALGSAKQALGLASVAPSQAGSGASAAASGGGGALSGLFKAGSGSAGSSALSGLGLNAKTGLTALSMLGALGSSTAEDKEAEKAAKQAEQEQERFNAPIPTYQMARTQVDQQPIDYYSYGYGPEQEFYDRNGEYDVAAASGGSIGELMAGAMPERQQGYIEGEGDGREDLIKARLSDGEYVIDAETVALLGDGSNKAGAQRLDEMREAIRAHKGGALAQGQISPDAAHPAQYLGVMR